MEYQTEINGLPVAAHFSDENVQEIFLPLLKELDQMQQKKGARLLVMLAAPGGAGKSTLVSFLEALSKEALPDSSFRAIGMDGFHYPQAYLNSHTVTVDGETYPMAKIKGSPPTFDLELLKASIRKLLTEEELGWPVYDRKLHDPVPDALLVREKIILLEGNYLLLDVPGWKDVSEMADYTIFLRADEKTLRERLVSRKAAGGTPREEAERFVDYSDMKNVGMCLYHSKEADLTLETKEAGVFRIASKKTQNFL